MELTGAWCFGRVLPALAVYGVGALSVALALLMVRKIFAWRRMHRAADRSAAGKPVLKRGPAILNGRVADGDEPAVQVRITHERVEVEGDEGPRDIQHYYWKEAERSIAVRTFDLVLPSGERVEVHPDEKVELADPLDRLESSGETIRVQIAELSPGEPVIVVGDLEQRPAGSDGYRGTQMRWVMTPPRRGRMVLSTEPLGARYERRARRGLRTLLLGLLVGLGLHAMAAGYHLRVWRGQTVTGTLTRIVQWTTRDDDGDLDRHARAVVELPDGTRVEERISIYSLEGAGSRGDPLPVRMVPGYRWATALGREPTLHLAVIVAHAVLPLVLGLMFIFIVKEEWYEENRRPGAPAPMRKKAPEAERA